MIIVESYNPLWKDQFLELYAVYNRHLGNLVEGIEHVGSTAVPGLAAKPILDIDLIIEEQDKLGTVIKILQQLGYQYRGELGIRDRHAFSQESASVPFAGTKRAWPKHNLYCCLKNSESLANHLLLRDALRNDVTLRRAYEALKIKLAEQVQGDIDAYVAGKSTFIANILLQEGMHPEDTAEIIRQNRKVESR